MNYVTSMVYKVSNVNGAAQFLTDALGFYQQQPLVNGSQIENGSVTILLEEEMQPEYSDKGLHFELKTRNITEANSNILCRLEVKLLSSIEQISRVHCENRVQGPFGITIICDVGV